MNNFIVLNHVFFVCLFNGTHTSNPKAVAGVPLSLFNLAFGFCDGGGRWGLPPCRSPTYESIGCDSHQGRVGNYVLQLSIGQQLRRTNGLYQHLRYLKVLKKVLMPKKNISLSARLFDLSSY